jgi:hypothetical protein
MKTFFSFFKNASMFTFVVIGGLTSSCDDQWGDDAQMGYVSAIEPGNDGVCTYYFSFEPEGKSRDRAIDMTCGLYTVGEGIFIDKDK